jgi:hypothetical protein
MAMGKPQCARFQHVVWDIFFSLIERADNEPLMQAFGSSRQLLLSKFDLVEDGPRANVPPSVDFSSQQ